MKPILLVRGDQNQLAHLLSTLRISSTSVPIFCVMVDTKINTKGRNKLTNAFDCIDLSTALVAMW